MISVSINAISFKFPVSKTIYQFFFFQFDFTIKIPVRSLEILNPLTNFVCFPNLFQSTIRIYRF